MVHRCAWLGNLRGGFGGLYMYVFSSSSTNPKYRIVKMKKKKKKSGVIVYFKCKAGL